ARDPRRAAAPGRGHLRRVRRLRASGSHPGAPCDDGRRPAGAVGPAGLSRGVPAHAGRRVAGRPPRRARSAVRGAGHRRRADSSGRPGDDSRRHHGPRCGQASGPSRARRPDRGRGRAAGVLCVVQPPRPTRPGRRVLRAGARACRRLLRRPVRGAAVKTGEVVDQLLLTLLLVDAVLLAVLELFFAPLRLDGAVLPLAGWAPVPISLLLAAVSTPWLVVRTAELADRMHAPRGLAALPLGLWLVTVLGLGLGGPGGDLVLIQDWRGIGLLAAGVIPGAMALGMRLGRGANPS